MNEIEDIDELVGQYHVEAPETPEGDVLEAVKEKRLEEKISKANWNKAAAASMQRIIDKYPNKYRVNR